MEELCHAPHQRLDLHGPLDLVGQRLHPRPDIGLGPGKLGDGDALDPLDEDPQRTVGHFDHLEYPGHGADGMNVAGACDLRIHFFWAVSPRILSPMVTSLTSLMDFSLPITRG